MGTTTNAISALLASNDNGAVYLYDDEKLRKNITELSRAFGKYYKNFRIAYSYKTNYLLDIVKTVSDIGCMAEVVSPAEFWYANEVGCHLSNIVYNGVIPDSDGKFAVARNGGYVNVDNYAEYESLSFMAHMTYKPICLGVRVNIDIGNDLVSRFGVDVDGEEFNRLMDAIEKDGLVNFRGFQCHIGTSRPVKYWLRKVERMIRLAKRYNASYIDLGGGMFGPMPESLAKQFSGYTGSFEEYGREVGSAMAEAFPDERVTLIVEPGTALVGNTMSVAARITNIKDVRGQTYVTVNCSSNHLGFICECKRVPITTVESFRLGCERVSVRNAIIGGNTCLEYDYLCKNVDLPDIAVGDIIIFENVGAYSICASRQFIVPRLAVLDAYTGRVLKTRETSPDMFYGYYEHEE